MWINLKRMTAALASAALLLAAAAVVAHQARAADAVPAAGVASDTFLVARMNVSKMDPASLEAAARAVLGPNVAAMPQVQDGLAKYRDKYTQYTQAGAESMTMVVGGDPNDTDGKKTDPVVYLKLKPGSDYAAVEKKIREDQAKDGKDKETDISHEGDYLVMRPKGKPAPAGSDAARAKSFADVLAGSDKAISLAFLPTDAIRSKMKAEAAQADASQPTWVKAIGPLLADSKWVRVDMSLGDSPVLGLTVQAADEASAKQIVDAATQGAGDLKARAAQMRQAPPQFAAMADALNGLADALKPTQNGSKITMSVDGKTVGPIISNILPLLMMGQQGGPRGGGAGPRPGPGSGF